MPKFRAISKRLKPAADNPRPPGMFSFGAQIYGGPTFTDPFQSKRAPSPWQLVENYNSLIYAMVERNRNSVSRIPLRLFADGSRAQGGKPGRACDPIKVSRHIGAQLARAGKISASAVDQVYEIRSHPMVDTLDQPDPYGFLDRCQLIGLICAYCDVVGHFELVPEGNGWDWTRENNRPKGPPEYLWVTYPQYTIPVRAPASPLIEYFQYFASRIPFESTVWFRNSVSLRDAYGASFSPTYASETYRLQEQEQIQILSQVLGLGPRPNMLISAKDPNMGLTSDQGDRLAKDMTRKHAAGAAGNVMWVNDAVEVTPMSYSPADMAGKEMAEYDLYRMAAIFGQPATYYTVDTNINNLQAADEQYARCGIEPRLRMIEGPLNRLVRQMDPRLFFKFDPALPEDEESHMKVVQMRLDAGLTTPNQENEESQWPPFPEGDEHWIPGTKKPMSQIMAEHEMAKEQQTAAMESGEQADEIAADGHEHQKKMDQENLKIDKKQASKESQRFMSDADIAVLCTMMLEKSA